jgi:large subunit ribosomal protein L35
MPKMKTHSGAKKRFRKTSKGKLRARHPMLSHNTGKKRPKRKRGEHQDAEVPVVPAAAEEVDARPKRVALDPEAQAALFLSHKESAPV